MRYRNIRLGAVITCVGVALAPLSRASDGATAVASGGILVGYSALAFGGNGARTLKLVDLGLAVAIPIGMAIPSKRGRSSGSELLAIGMLAVPPLVAMAAINHQMQVHHSDHGTIFIANLAGLPGLALLNAGLMFGVLRGMFC